MRKIRKFQYAGPISYLPSIKLEMPNILPQVPQLNQSTVLAFTPRQSIRGYTKDLWLSKNGSPSASSTSNTSSADVGSSNTGNQSVLNQVAVRGTQAAADTLGNTLSGLIFDDSELGRGLGTLFSSGISTSADTIAQNLFKGEALTQGLGQNLGASLSGTAAGLAGYGIGQGIRALGGDSKLSRGIGAGVATGIGSVGGAALQGALSGFKVGNDVVRGAQGALAGVKSINPWALGMQVAGAGLQAALGPSKEYGGKYGNITKTADTVYDIASMASTMLPGGQFISGAMSLNKGLSNLFGSTDGMTKQDAWLGSAFMPAPIKWFNMWGAKTTDTFNDQSWQNTQKTNAFMGNAFGNLGEKFSKATEEAGKTYGTTSRGAYNKAQKNIEFANNAWGKILTMADQNELQKIRSQYMTSINNQRYAQNIQGGWSPLQRGKYGMKILNNATNHNIGMRLLSGAALIDDKQMILSAQAGTKIEFKSELDWTPESWFSKRVRKPDGTYYTDEDAARLASHVPEYLAIEEEAKNNGTWLQMLDGSKWTGDPRSWVMMQSEAYRKNYSPKPWWTGQAEWPTKYDYGSGTIDTNKVTRAPYYNNQMWFSDVKGYGDYFADYVDSSGLRERSGKKDEKDVKGHNFLAAIPLKGNYRVLESPSSTIPDWWQSMPYYLEGNEIKRLPSDEQILHDYKPGYFKGRRYNLRKDGKKVLTDDVVNWSKNLGDQGIFMQNINDGPVVIKHNNKTSFDGNTPVNEFISQPGFTNKVKFIEGNTGDFDINNPYKYTGILKKNLNQV